MVRTHERRRVWTLALALTTGLVFLTALTACGSDEEPATIEATGAVVTTIEYADGLTEDLYLPERTPQRVPLVVLVPGGSWQTADPSGLAALALRLADDGIAAAPTHLRAAQDGVTYPVPVEDVLCAVAAAVGQMRAAGAHPSLVAVLGHSSGAHLAALAVLAYDDYEPQCSAPAVEPDALIGLSGPYDISRVPDLAEALLGSAPEDDPAGWAAADPVQRATLRPHVPVLLLHGGADEVVPLDFTTQFARALEDGGHPTTVRIVPDADHLGIIGADVAGGPILDWLSDQTSRG